MLTSHRTPMNARLDYPSSHDFQPCLESSGSQVLILEPPLRSFDLINHSCESHLDPDDPQMVRELRVGFGLTHNKIQRLSPVNLPQISSVVGTAVANLHRQVRWVRAYRLQFASPNRISNILPSISPKDNANGIKPLPQIFHNSCIGIQTTSLSTSKTSTPPSFPSSALFSIKCGPFSSGVNEPTT
ncbi:MAG: hypothetical protein Ct9H90mP16_15330 [Candidatus Poseidoniales archaeon]|nr:MAG: hypothetical protein Ct9H90mP16_15330 [Candidatus Poseidoniales archaeon]